MNISNTRKDRGNESVPPFTIMQHEIIVSVYDSAYTLTIVIDGQYTTNPDVKRKCIDVVFYGPIDAFISYVAGLYDWNAGDVVRFVWCEDGGIDICTKTVR